MSYDIRLTNGTQLKLLEDNSGIDGETVSNISLISKLTPNYGTSQSENFIHLAEHFADNQFPKNPLLGMICYRDDKKSLYLCVNPNVNSSNENECWLKLPNVNIQQEQPSVITSESGEFWFNPDEKKLYIFDKELSQWIGIGPDNFLNKTSDSKNGETGDSDTYVYTYNFDEHNEKPNTSYLATIKIVGKEYFNEKSSQYNIKKTETAAWIIKCLINSYKTTINDFVITRREIVGEPNYEIIGKTNGVAVNWDVEASINPLTYNLDVTCRGLSTNPQDNMKVKWIVDVEMIKVYDKDE